MPLPRMRSLNRRAVSIVSDVVADHLEQMQIPRRIEEVHAEESSAKRRRSSVREQLDRNARRVRRDDRVFGKERLETLKKLAFGIELLDDRFDHQVTARKSPEIVFRVSNLDRRRAVHIHEGRRLGFLGALDSTACQCVSIRARCRNVQQHHRDTSRRGQRRDAAPHRPRPDYPQLSDPHLFPQEVAVPAV
jgi:hypothetical protein